MITIYAPYPTARLHYVLGVLFQEQYLLTNQLQSFNEASGAKIYYSREAITGSYFTVEPAGLLQERGVREQSIACFQWEGLTAFFSSGGDIPFDFLSASFYLLTRYEEYLPHTTDQYGRYDHTNSIAWKNKFLHLPLVQLWMKLINRQLQQRFPEYAPPVHNFRFIPSYDIDIAYCFRHQPVWKNIADFFKDIIRMDIDRLMLRGKVLAGSATDPFDVYDWLDTLHNEYQLQPAYFFLIAGKRTRYDKNIRVRLLRNLIVRHAGKYQTGLHPSWRCADDESILWSEKQALEKYIQQFVFHSRQHYLHFAIPRYYRQLINVGIEHDYSMGYGSVNGFRASYANPFYWYDIDQEAITSLMIHPFCFMDSTAIFHEKHTPETAYQKLQEYYTTVKQVSGNCMIVVHNHLLSNQRDTLVWRNAYEYFLQQHMANH